MTLLQPHIIYDAHRHAKCPLQMPCEIHKHTFRQTPSPLPIGRRLEGQFLAATQNNIHQQIKKLSEQQRYSSVHLQGTPALNEGVFKHRAVVRTF